MFMDYLKMFGIGGKQFLIESLILQYMALGRTSFTFLLMKKKYSNKKLTKTKY